MAQKLRQKWKKYLVIVLTIYILLSIVIGETFFSLSRHREYPVDPASQGATKIFLPTSSHDLVLWHMDNGASQLVLIVHGHMDNSGYMFERYVPLFVDMGFDILTIDLRNHGLSEDLKPVTYGTSESHDIELALSWINRTQYSEVILFGTSMGAVASLLAVENKPEMISGLILDSIYIDISNTLKLNMRKHFIPPFLFFGLVKGYLNLRYQSFNYDLNKFPDLINIMQKVSDSIPTIVLRGSEDKEVSAEDFQIIIDQVPNCETFVIENGDHSRLHLHDTYYQILENWMSFI